MTALEQIRDFISSYPRADVFRDFQVDFTDKIPDSGGIFPSGLVEISRRKDLLGNVAVENQYNFALYCVFQKAPGDDEGAAYNADWLMDFQEWVQEQSALGQAPVFGDVPRKEHISAQNGVLFDAQDEGTAMYTVQLSVQFVKEFKTTNPWFM